MINTITSNVKIMKNLLLLIFLFARVILCGQSVSQLDEKYGFKSFKFNSSTAILKGKLVESQVNSMETLGVKSFLYTGQEYQDVFGCAVDDINLHYYKDKLFQITISFYDGFSNEEFNKIKYSLEKLYGIAKRINKPEDSDIKDFAGYGWVGAKVKLELIRIEFFDLHGRGGYISITEENIFQQVLKNGF